jgi:formylglycine-generating enzyme required for sulfatase activity
VSRAWSGTGDPSAMGWHAANGGGRLHPVGQRSPNAFGIFDMHGNVAEWCSAHDPIERNNAADASGIWLLRGGSVFDPPERCRSAARAAPDPAQLANTGLRLVIDSH